MPIYEIINPSDKCTLEADTDQIASVAVLVLGDGAYGVERCDGEPMEITAPFIRFAPNPDEALEQWAEKHLGMSVDSFCLERRENIASALRSVLYASAEDRLVYSRALELMDSPAAREQWQREWEDRRRTSLTKICQRAWRLANAFGAGPKTNAQ